MKLQEKGDTSQNEKLSLFYETLKSPLFNQILTLQQSIKQLKGQVSYPSRFYLLLLFKPAKKEKEIDTNSLHLILQRGCIGTCVQVALA